MKRIAIIGAGQAGSLAAVGLMNAGYEVTIYTDRSGTSMLNDTAPTGTAFLLGDSVAVERKHGVDTFEDRALPGEGVHLFFNPHVGQELVTVSGVFDSLGYGIDVRLKSKARLDQLEAGGARVVIERVTPDRLDDIARRNQLTLVATGRGALATMFARDLKRSGYTEPQRYLGMLIVKNVPTDGSGFPHRIPGKRCVCFNFFGDIGECFWVPYYHKTQGPCWNLVIEAKHGGPLDIFRNAKSAEDMLAAVRTIAGTFTKWDWQTVKDMELIDDDPHCWLRGQVVPTVRQPVTHTKSGHPVWALGDTAYSFDPIGGQGAGCGVRQAGTYVDAIIERGDRPLDESFMTDTAETFYATHGESAYNFNHILLEPLDDIGKLVVISSFGDPRAASRFFRGFNQPCDLYPMLTDKAAAKKWVSEAVQGSWRKANFKGVLKIIKGRLRQKLHGRHFAYDDVRR